MWIYLLVSLVFVALIGTVIRFLEKKKKELEEIERREKEQENSNNENL